MNLEEFRKKRKARLENLQEALSNMPELVDDKVHGEVGAVEMDAIKSSKERDEKVKDSFKDKNKEVKEFVKKQDKDRKVDKEEESEKRLMLDESLFDKDYDDEDELIDEPLEEESEPEKKVEKSDAKLNEAHSYEKSEGVIAIPISDIFDYVSDDTWSKIVEAAYYLAEKETGKDLEGWYYDYRNDLFYIYKEK